MMLDQTKLRVVRHLLRRLLEEATDLLNDPLLMYEGECAALVGRSTARRHRALLDHALARLDATPEEVSKAFTDVTAREAAWHIDPFFGYLPPPVHDLAVYFDELMDPAEARVVRSMFS
jgi:hypothetical protein